MQEVYKFPFPRDKGVVKVFHYPAKSEAMISIFINKFSEKELSTDMVDTVQLALYYAATILNAKTIICRKTIREDIGIPGFDNSYHSKVCKCTELIRRLNAGNMMRIEKSESIEWHIST